MKIQRCLIALFIIVFCACSKDAVIPFIVSYQQSLNNWNTYKASVHNNYTYTVVSGSVFGFGSETKITVQGGKVTAREYKATRKKYQSSIDSVYSTWTETAATLNSHAEGAKSLTMDQVYNKAKTEWLAADKNKNDIYFDTDAKGLLSSCGYVPKGCQDDCFNGITVKEIVGL